MTEPLRNHGDHGDATVVTAVQAPQWHRTSGVTGVLGFPEYGMANASNFLRGFTPASNPESGTTYGQRNWLLFMLKGPRLKTASCRTFVFPEYGMTNATNFSRGFTPSSNPEWGKTYRQLAFIYVKMAKTKTVSHRILGFP